jgi:hypothetical protein
MAFFEILGEADDVAHLALLSLGNEAIFRTAIGFFD